ncbi:carbohydrate esterase family 1 protein [Xylogone sp. PMI_703]|nr:carbohydrate esterase family 1 protein [Xylogone sp. PMI_703]
MVQPLLIAALVVASCLAGINADATAGCGKALPNGQSAGGVSTVSMTSNGIQRKYLVWIPPSYDRNTLTSLILSFHGGSRTANDQLNLDEFTTGEFDTNSIVIYPQGIDNNWQGVPDATTNDVLFTTDLLDRVEGLYCLDTNRIFSTGKSDGGGFTNVLACDPNTSKRIAAFAPVSGAYYVDTLPCKPTTVQIPCSPGRSNIPLLAFHGGDDTTIKFGGGERKDACLPSITHWIQGWATREGMSSTNVTTPLATNTVIYSFGSGSNAGLVSLVFESDIGHDWPSTESNADNSRSGHHVANFDATPMILDFFNSHPLN